MKPDHVILPLTFLTLLLLWPPAVQGFDRGPLPLQAVESTFGPATPLLSPHVTGPREPISLGPSALFDDEFWTAFGGGAGFFFGFSLATAGDVNGDGYSDVIVGSPLYNNGHTKEGKADVYLGTANGLSSTPVWTYESNRPFSEMGFSVSTAGDVNGDGYDDIIVGDRTYTGGQTEEGRAQVYHGSASGPSLIPNWSVLGGWLGGQFGFSVSTAGDVNGDGYADVIVGAPHVGGGLLLVDQGAAHVYHGGPNGLDTVNATWMLGGQTGSEFGSAVGTAGDVNGDGYDDVIVGSQGYDAIPIFGDQGRVHVFLGSQNGVGVTAEWIENGTTIGEHFGCSVSTAGDIDGDGYSDVIIGAEDYNDGSLTLGRAYVYMGSDSGLSPTAAWIENGSTEEQFGQSVSTAGDVNGDGFADVVIGAPFHIGVGWGEGRILVYLGSATGLPSAPEWTRAWGYDNAAYGWAVATAGDVNGDGVSDLLAGAPQHDARQTNIGAANCFYGSTDALASNPYWFGEGDQDTAYFGLPGAAAGDVNGDGYDDVILSSYLDDSAGIEAGKVSVYHGSPFGLPYYASPDWTAVGEVPGDQFGIGAPGAGDVNGDGYDDVLIGAVYHDGAFTDGGKVYLYTGGPNGLDAMPAWTVEGDQDTAHLFVVAGAGDVDGDGCADILTAATGWTGDFNSQGKAWLYMGSASGPETPAAWSVEGPEQVAFLGRVATAGDVNADGYSDVLVGVGNYTDQFLGEGIAWLYMGSASGLSPTSSWSVVGGEIGAHLKEVESAGDVNGDGFGDVIVGARYKGSPQGGSGTAWVYHGSAQGLSPTPAVTLGIAQSNAQFGRVVGGAGDVNGDGFSDVIVGATTFTLFTTSEGAAYLYLGSSTGISDTPDWSRAGTQPNEWFGRVASSLGDINGDGFADVLITSSGYDALFQDEGRAQIFLGNALDSPHAPLTLAPRQRHSGGGPLALLGRSDSEDSMQLELRGRSPAGRTRVRMEWAAEPLGTPLPTTGTVPVTWTDTGSVDPTMGSGVEVSQVILGLATDTPHHWRVRVVTRTPLFPRSRWMTVEPSVPTLTQFRTASAGTPVEQPDVPVAIVGLGFQSVRPNPFNPRTTISFSIPHDGPVRLRVYDLRGRLVATLVDTTLPRGSHNAAWDGSDIAGLSVASGVYLAHLEMDGLSRAVPLTLLK